MNWLEEAFGRTAPEAMSVGTAVVATKVGGLPETVRHLETGLLVKPAHPEKLADAVLRLLDDPALRARLARNGQTFVRRHFTPQRHLEQVEAAYGDVARSVPARQRAA